MLVSLSKPPRLTVVIPSLDGDRNGRLAELLEALKRQSFRDFEVRVVLGDPRQGRAINQAVRSGGSDIIVTLDDDSQLGHRRVLENLVRAIDADPTIGIAGGSTVPAPDASWMQRAACRQIPRRYFPVVDRVVDSDMAQHPCLAMRREVFEAVGGEDEELIRGLDPDLRHRVRQAGYRVTIVPDTWVGHPLPEGLGKLFGMFVRNGRGSAFARRHFGERVYELTDGTPDLKFAPQRPFWYRLVRYPFRMLRSVVAFHWIKFLSEVAYLAGYLQETLFSARTAEPPPPPGRMIHYPSPAHLPGPEFEPARPSQRETVRLAAAR